jgi:hypothetical protein
MLSHYYMLIERIDWENADIEIIQVPAYIDFTEVFKRWSLINVNGIRSVIAFDRYRDISNDMKAKRLFHDQSFLVNCINLSKIDWNGINGDAKNYILDHCDLDNIHEDWKKALKDKIINSKE